MEPRSLALQVDSLSSELPGKPQNSLAKFNSFFFLTEQNKKNKKTDMVPQCSHLPLHGNGISGHIRLCGPHESMQLREKQDGDFFFISP